MYLALALWASLPPLVLSVFIETGTTILNTVTDQCGNRQEFQCDESVKPRVLSFVNNTHPAATEFFDDAVM